VTEACGIGGSGNEFDGWYLSFMSPGSAAAKSPNIIFLLTDDLSMNLVSFMPNVLEMEKEGTEGIQNSHAW
jgi:hypothetical protein